MSFMALNLAGLRTALRDRTGYPERGSTGTERYKRVLNYALRKLWTDLPPALIRDEYRIQAIPAQSTSTLNATLEVDPSDALVMRIDDPTVNIANKEVWRGAWLRIIKGDVYFYRRVQDFYRSTSWTAGNYDHIVLDRPWENTTDTDLNFRMFIQEYAYPADFQRVTSIVRSPETAPFEVTQAVYPEEMQRIRLAESWETDGLIEAWSVGDAFQLQAPHYTPTVAFPTPGGTIPEQAAKKWGHDPSTGVEDFNYGAAGTFSYRVCHVWGRLAHAELLLNGSRYPKYISAPSPPSEQITSSWDVAESAIRITTPNVSWAMGYGSDPVGKPRSYNHSGLEKWIFRARHATQSPTDAGNDATVKNIDSDGVYYLWQIIDGDDVVTQDNGQLDPPDRRYQLKDFHGHQHVRFDRAPSEATMFLLNVVRRPPTIEYETDVPTIPGDCFDALTSLMSALFVGDRDGDAERKSFYMGEYLNELARLRRIYVMGQHQSTPFGDGMGMGMGRAEFFTAGAKISEIT